MASPAYLLAHNSGTRAHIGVDSDGVVYVEHADGVTTRIQEATSQFFRVTDYAPANTPRDGTVDWMPYIQAAIDDAIAVNGINIGRASGIVFFPPGKYKITAPLRIMGEFTAQSVWSYCSVVLLGEGPAYANGWNATSIEPTFNDGPALVMQGTRGVYVSNIAFMGQNNFLTQSPWTLGDWISPHWDDANYLVGTARLNRYSPHTAVAIDPFHENIPTNDRYPALTQYYTNIGTGGGSSQITFENCWFYGFVAGVVITPQLGSPLGMQNAENIHFIDCKWQVNRDGLCIGQEQSREITVTRGLLGAGRSGINCVDYGAGRGQPPNIADTMMGSTKWQWKVTPGWTAPVKVSGVYSENMISIGFPSSMHFYGCKFGFAATPAGKPAIPKLMPLGRLSFSGCQFIMADSQEPMLVSSTNYARVGFSDCTFQLNTTADVAPRHWIAGLRHLYDYDRCDEQTAPNNAYYGPRWQVDFLSNLFNHALQPGTIFSAAAGTEAARMLDTQWPSTSGGSPSVTIYADGHATIPGANLDQIYAVGDIVETTTTYDASVWESQAVSPIVNTTILGKVSAVTPTEVTVSHVPFFMCPASGSTTAAHTLTIRWLPRVHEPTTGTINAGDLTQLTGVTPDPSANNRWQVGNRIRDKQGNIPAGTYVKTVAGTTITLSKAATGGGGTLVDLYGATVYTLGRTQIP